MPVVELSNGPIEYGDTGGTGPTVVFVQGLIMNAGIWAGVLDALPPGIRAITPTVPLGGHRLAQHPDADLSLPGLARMLGEFLDRLDLTDVTLVVSDGGWPLLLAAERHPRLGRLVLTPCEAFDHLPPGLPGKVAELSGRLPGGIFLALQSLRLPGGARLPLTFGRMSKRGVPRAMVLDWIAPGRRDRGVRADLRKYIQAADPVVLLRATEALRDFDRPTLVVWTPEEKVVDPADGRRLAELVPGARLVEVPDSYTLIALDQPARLAELVGDFALAPAGA